MISLRDFFMSLIIMINSCIYNVIYFIDAQGNNLRLACVKHMDDSRQF